MRGDTQKRAFPAAIGANKGDDLPHFDLQRDRIKRAKTAVHHGGLARDKQRLVGGGLRRIYVRHRPLRNSQRNAGPPASAVTTPTGNLPVPTSIN